MKKQLIAKIMQCETVYQIREVWEEVTSNLKSDNIDIDDFIAIKYAKYDRLNTIEASDVQSVRSQYINKLVKQAI